MMSLVDFLVVIIVVATLKYIAADFDTGKPLTIGNVFGIPALYLVLSSYIVLYINFLFPRKLKLTWWLLVSFAFKEGYYKKKSIDQRYNIDGIQLTDLLGWASFVLVVLSAWLFGFWLLKYPFFVEFYYLSFIEMALFISIFELLKSLKNNPLQNLAACTVIVIIFCELAGAFFKLNSVLRHNVIYYSVIVFTGLLTILSFCISNSHPLIRIVIKHCRTNILGSGIIIAFTVLVFIPREWENVINFNIPDRAVIAISVAIPFILFGIYLPKFPNHVIKILSSIVDKSVSFNFVRDVAVSSRRTIINNRLEISLKSLLVSGLFILYFLIPKMGQLLEYAGISNLNGIPIRQFLANFETVSGTWSIPNSPSLDELLPFIFGNQGLVMLYLLWCFASLLSWVNVNSYLEKIPKIFDSRSLQFVLFIHFSVFILLFFPFLLITTIVIPLFGSMLLGQSFAIFIGVFAFGLLLPAIVSYLLSLGYLIYLPFLIDYDRDAVNINLATIEVLVLLPGIHRKLARKIIQNRPFTEIDDLALIKGIGRQKIDDIYELIRL